MESFELDEENRRSSFDFNPLRDTLNILVSKSESFDDSSDLSSKSSKKIPSPVDSFPLSRAILHEQLFGVSERTKEGRSYSATDVPLPSPSYADFSRSPRMLQMPKSSPGMLGSLGTLSSRHSEPMLQAAPYGFGDKHGIHPPPPLDISSRYMMPPSLSNFPAYTPPATTMTFSGKSFASNVSNVSIAISPSYHAQYPAQATPRSNPVSPHPVIGNGKENPNLHYRPNREMQIAKLAQAKAAAAGLPIESVVIPEPPIETKPEAEVKVDRKPDVPYVYAVTLKTAVVWCLISSTCSLCVLSMNELVVFSTDGIGGEEIGFVSNMMTMKAFSEQHQTTEEVVSSQLKQIIRAATEADRKETAKNRLEEADIVERLFDLNNTTYRLPIIILDAQYQLDRKKLTICYRETQPGVNTDGRELMKDLFQMVQTRIVMKKIVSGGVKF